MRAMQVDPYGIKIMLPKAVHYLMQVGPVSNIAANILKQEMLSLGADAAIARGALTGKTKESDCLLIANLAQLGRLAQKLKIQPFGLAMLSRTIEKALKDYQKDRFILKLKNKELVLSPDKTRIMGIINVTPDSFSNDGFYYATAGEIVEHAQKIIAEGADIIDIGGESSRPGARKVSEKEELERTIPVIKALAKKIRVPISIDTAKPAVAARALDSGASIVNDITGLRSKEMRGVISKRKAAVVVMHMKGTPRSMQKNPKYTHLIDEIIDFLDNAICHAQESGIKKENIIIDPGIGFGKTAGDNLEIIQKLDEFKVLGRPILIGTSRKSFIGKILNTEPKERLLGTVSSCVLAARNGASILRVHDVKEVKQAMRVSNAILSI
jgi:dihydropteroate synthase